jgi:hypothetical protein
LGYEPFLVRKKEAPVQSLYSTYKQQNDDDDVLIGSFLAWNFDMTLGFPMSWSQRLVSFNLMLLQCWLVHHCHETVFHEPSRELPAKNVTAPGPSIFMIV